MEIDLSIRVRKNTKKHCILQKLTESTEPAEAGNNSIDTDAVPEKIDTDPDDDVIITKVVETSFDEVEIFCRKSIKIESDKSQCEGNIINCSEISLAKIMSNVLSRFTINKERRLEGPEQRQNIC